MFDFYTSKFARDGFLDAADQRDLERYATERPLTTDAEDSLRLYGASEALAARLIAERSQKHLEMAARALDVASGLPVADAERFVGDLRMMRGAPPAALAAGLQCGRDWHDVADAIERKLAPKPSRRVA